MVEQFFSVDYVGRSDLFEGTKLWNDEKYHTLQGKFPVISLSFAGVKGTRELMVKTFQEMDQGYHDSEYLDYLAEQEE